MTRLGGRKGRFLVRRPITLIIHSECMGTWNKFPLGLQFFSISSGLKRIDREGSSTSFKYIDETTHRFFFSSVLSFLHVSASSARCAKVQVGNTKKKLVLKQPNILFARRFLGSCSIPKSKMRDGRGGRVSCFPRDRDKLLERRPKPRPLGKERGRMAYIFGNPACSGSCYLIHSAFLREKSDGLA